MSTSAPPIRDAATLIIVDDSSVAPRVLLGRRRADLVFLPNVFVFPGGRVDADDAAAPSADDLEDGEASLLAANLNAAPSSAAFVRALALAAVRETYEETGIVVGAAGPAPAVVPEAWTPFLRHSCLPALAQLRYILRAITPPGRPRRYDTRFFMVNATAIATRAAALDDELSEIGWFTVAELRALDVPRMTRIAIDELVRVFTEGLAPPPERSVPFYFEHNAVMHRAELSLSATRS